MWSCWWLQALEKEQLGNLLNDFERIRNAARPEGVPDAVNLIADFTGKHNSQSTAPMAHPRATINTSKDYGGEGALSHNLEQIRTKQRFFLKKRITRGTGIPLGCIRNTGIIGTSGTRETKVQAANPDGPACPDNGNNGLADPRNPE
jgi:hypothetical protein